MNASGGKLPAMEWGAAWRPIEDEAFCGDQCAVIPAGQGALVGVVDGLGHGKEAELAALTALDVMRAHPHDSVESVLRECHVALQRTRGGAMSLAAFARDDASVSWVGVGNVEGVLVRFEAKEDVSQERLLLKSGVVGGGMPALRVASLPIFVNDMLLFATDGIQPGFSRLPVGHLSCQGAAEKMLAEFSDPRDDALVLVARYLGSLS